MTKRSKKCLSPNVKEFLNVYQVAVVIETILKLGNEVLSMLGVEEPIDDVAVFFSDQFYIQFFEIVFQDEDFSSLQEAQTDEDMANNI
jgi:hypothetical protein